MTHTQPADSFNAGTAPRYYAWCPCGVCGPVRAREADAVRDGRAHQAVCAARLDALAQYTGRTAAA